MLRTTTAAASLVPAGDWVRGCSPRSQELVAGGGDLVATGQIDAARTDYSASITEVLRISESAARYKRLESVLGTKLQFEPRRRSDIEFIFAPAQANTERLLRPQLRFHYAGDIPTYATSDAFEPDAKTNEDLDGLMFPDMPWVLGGDLPDAVRAATREAWPSGGPYRGRLFAFVSMPRPPGAAAPQRHRQRQRRRAYRAPESDADRRAPRSAGRRCTVTNCACCRPRRNDAATRKPASTSTPDI